MVNLTPQVLPKIRSPYFDMKNRKPKIIVSECDEYFRVYLPSPIFRDRAKAIEGRKYNARERFWYWNKTSEAYQSIKREFLNNSLSFDLKEPEKIIKETPSNIDSVKTNSGNKENTNEKIFTEIEVIKNEIIDFKKTDIEQTETIQLISKQLSDQFKGLEKKVFSKALDQGNGSQTLEDLFVWGVGCSKKDQLKNLNDLNLNFNDSIGCVNTMYHQIVLNLFNLLDIPIDRRQGYNLFDLVNEAQDLGVIDRNDSNNLHNFRRYRNICAHGIAENALSQAKQKVAAAIALLCVSMSYNSTLKD